MRHPRGGARGAGRARLAAVCLGLEWSGGCGCSVTGRLPNPIKGLRPVVTSRGEPKFRPDDQRFLYLLKDLRHDLSVTFSIRFHLISLAKSI